MTGRFEINLSEADLVSAFRLNARMERLRLLILAALLVLTILAALLVLSPAARESATSRPLTLVLEGAAGILILIVAALLIALRPLWRRIARMNLAQRRDLAETIRYEFSPESLRHVTCFSDSTYPWSALHGWREDDRTLMIYISHQLFYPIPKHQVDPATLTSLREALSAAGVRRS